MNQVGMRPYVPLHFIPQSHHHAVLCHAIRCHARSHEMWPVHNASIRNMKIESRNSRSLSLYVSVSLFMSLFRSARSASLAVPITVYIFKWSGLVWSGLALCLSVCVSVRTWISHRLSSLCLSVSVSPPSHTHGRCALLSRTVQRFSLSLSLCARDLRSLSLFVQEPSCSGAHLESSGHANAPHLPRGVLPGSS
ncbi:hypothetical protein GGR56DRAFT_373391 [Xylariaceae sp. FL0804]|nr:hypothetical protein GGR56DRAFT_373391 [Xylariaceae sp. FL0804]